MVQITRDGNRTASAAGQDKLLKRLYGNAFGRMLLKLLTRPFLSKIVGWFLSTRPSCCFIKGFVRKHNIDMTQFEPTQYHSYNEFFSRKIRPEVRPVDTDPKHLISPCDSKLTVLPISAESILTLKNTDYTVSSLLRNDPLAQEYVGGYALIFRLTVDDYHRYCYVADGQKEANTFIRGVLHTVNPIANNYYPIYKENSREYSIQHTREFDDIVMMEVGALLVGKIVNHHQQAQVSRGQEKGFFQFGGSTVVLLFKPGTIQPDADILKNSAEGAETVVRYGEKVGISLH